MLIVVFLLLQTEAAVRAGLIAVAKLLWDGSRRQANRKRAMNGIERRKYIRGVVGNMLQ